MEHKQESVFERVNQAIKTSVSIKLLSIGFLIAILLIPNNMIQSLISERKVNQFEAEREVSEKWGAPVALTGPILTIPFERVHQGTEGPLVTKHYAHFLPTELNTKGDLTPSTRKRGIYEVVVYNTQLKVKGSFDEIEFEHLRANAEQVQWEEAFVSIGIPDMAGIQSDINLEFGEATYRMGPGIPVKDVIPSGVNARVSLDESTGKIDYAFDLNINGTKVLLFNPIGKSTHIQLNSTWPHPSFTGQFLPDQYEVTEGGFSAEWSVFDLNRNYPQSWVDDAHEIETAEFGVNLYQPVDNYQRNTRSAKYAVLILFLTFITFFFVEILNKKKIHPIQYILIGLALTVFYTLLLSLSEQIGFNAAYFTAAAIIIAMVTLYTRSILGSSRLALILLAFFSMIYAFIFVILQMEDQSLLVGSFGLVIVLALCMYLSRKVDWYNLKTKEKVTHAST